MDESERTSLSSFLDATIDVGEEVEPLFIQVLRYLRPTDDACSDNPNLMDFATRKQCCIAVPPDDAVLRFLRGIENNSVKQQALTAFCEWHLLVSDPRWQDKYHALPNFHAIVDVHHKNMIATPSGCGWPTPPPPEIQITFRRRRQSSRMASSIHPSNKIERRSRRQKYSLTIGLSEALIPLSMFIPGENGDDAWHPSVNCVGIPSASSVVQSSVRIELLTLSADEAHSLVVRSVASLSALGCSCSVRNCSPASVGMDFFSRMRNCSVAAWVTEQTTLCQLRLGFQVMNEMRDELFLRAKLAFRRAGAPRTLFGCHARMEFADLSRELELVNAMFAAVEEGEGSTLDPWRCCLLLFQAVEGMCAVIARCEGHGTHQFVSADSLVPIFIWMLISSNARHPWTTLALCKVALRCTRLWCVKLSKDAAQYIRHVLDSPDAAGEASSCDDDDDERDEWYHLVTLEGCLDYITNKKHNN